MLKLHIIVFYFSVLLHPLNQIYYTIHPNALITSVMYMCYCHLPQEAVHTVPSY